MYLIIMVSSMGTDPQEYVICVQPISAAPLQKSANYLPPSPFCADVLDG